jgi:hypothetical protein
MTTIGLAIDEDGVTFMFPLIVVKRILGGYSAESAAGRAAGESRKQE